MATRSRKPAAAEPKVEPRAEPARAPREPVVPIVARLSTDLRTLFVNLFLLVAFVLLVPVIVVQFTRTQVLIEPIAVPAALIARGLDGNVAANRLWDGLAEATTDAATLKTGISAMPQSERVDFSIPDAGISIDALVYYVRQFFHAYETRISGELRCADDACTPAGISLRLRIMREQLDVIQLPAIGGASESDYFRGAAIEILGKLDPYTAAAAVADAEPIRAMAEAQRLVLTHSPDAKWAANLVGHLKLNAGDVDEAVTAFKTALELDSSFLIAKTNLAMALTQRKDFTGAQQILDQVAQADPRSSYLAIAQAKLAEAKGDVDGAIKLLLGADANDPGTPKYLLLAANIALNAGRYDDVVAYAGRALEVDPANYAAVTLAYSIQVMNGASDKAAEVLTNALAYAPDAAAIESELVLVLIQQDRLEPALQHIEHVLSEAPADISYQLLHAQTLHYLHRDADALAQLDATAKADPDNLKLAMIYGDVYGALGRTADALSAYQRVVDHDPDADNVTEAKLRISQLQLAGGAAPSN